jgi:hypothetical protein
MPTETLDSELEKFITNIVLAHVTYFHYSHQPDEIKEACRQVAAFSAKRARGKAIADVAMYGIIEDHQILAERPEYADFRRAFNRKLSIVLEEVKSI